MRALERRVHSGWHLLRLSGSLGRLAAENSSQKVNLFEVVLGGAVAVRTSEGERELQRGDLVRYPPGPEGAHQITNRSDTTARVLLFSKAAVPAVAVYPDTDTIGVWPDDDTEYYFKRDTAVSRDDD